MNSRRTFLRNEAFAGLGASLASFETSEKGSLDTLRGTFSNTEAFQPRSVGKDLLRHSVHIYNAKVETDRALSLIESPV